MCSMVCSWLWDSYDIFRYSLAELLPFWHISPKLCRPFLIVGMRVNIPLLVAVNIL